MKNEIETLTKCHDLSKNALNDAFKNEIDNWETQTFTGDLKDEIYYVILNSLEEAFGKEKAKIDN